METKTCPKCNSEIKTTHIFADNLLCGTHAQAVGSCPCCKKEYTWCVRVRG